MRLWSRRPTQSLQAVFPLPSCRLRPPREANPLPGHAIDGLPFRAGRGPWFSLAVLPKQVRRSRASIASRHDNLGPRRGPRAQRLPCSAACKGRAPPFDGGAGQPRAHQSFPEPAAPTWRFARWITAALPAFRRPPGAPAEPVSRNRSDPLLPEGASYRSRAVAGSLLPPF